MDRDRGIGRNIVRTRKSDWTRRVRISTEYLRKNTLRQSECKYKHAHSQVATIDLRFATAAGASESKYDRDGNVQ